MKFYVKKLSCIPAFTDNSFIQWIKIKIKYKNNISKLHTLKLDLLELIGDQTA